MNAPIDINNLPTLSEGRLPAAYQQAVKAVAELTKIDECKDWGDKAAALASYAKQANDDRLVKMATKLQARAVQRCGELLAELPVDKRGPKGEFPAGDDTKLSEEFPTDRDTNLTRNQAASDAGLSERQKHTALRVAAVPKDEFEAAVESDDPPSVSKLAEKGTKKKPKKPKPAIDERVMFLWGRLREIEKNGLLEKRPADLTPKVPDIYRDDFTRIVPALTNWLKEFWP